MKFKRKVKTFKFAIKLKKWKEKAGRLKSGLMVTNKGREIIRRPLWSSRERAWRSKLGSTEMGMEWCGFLCCGRHPGCVVWTAAQPGTSDSETYLFSNAGKVWWVVIYSYHCGTLGYFLHWKSVLKMSLQDILSHLPWGCWSWVWMGLRERCFRWIFCTCCWLLNLPPIESSMFLL